MGNRTSPYLMVVFLAHRGSDEFPVEIGMQTTGQAALDGLVEAKFIEPATAQQTYALGNPRKGANLPLDAALAASGVQNGDRIPVIAIQAGAGSAS